MADNKTPENEISSQPDHHDANDVSTWITQIQQKLTGILANQKLSKDRKAVVLSDLDDAGSPDIDFFMMIIFSSAIASLGLIADLSVVTIGAQLIDPLMSPILGLSIASTSGINRMFNRSFIAVVEGAAAAVGLSAVLTFLLYRLPYGIHAEIPHEVMLRATTSPLDLGIAFVGGAAAAYALTHPNLDNVLPGVAIATAIMPPLCAIGFGIAFQSSVVFFGAILQFLTNLVAIAFAAIITFALLGFSPTKVEKNNDLHRPVLVAALMTLIITIPLLIFAWSTISSVRLNSRAREVVLSNLPFLAQPHLVDLNIDSTGEQKEITVSVQLVRELTSREASTLHKSLSDQFGEPVSLKIVTLPVQIIE